MVKKKRLLIIIFQTEGYNLGIPVPLVHCHHFQAVKNLPAVNRFDIIRKTIFFKPGTCSISKYNGIIVKIQTIQTALDYKMTGIGLSRGRPIKHNQVILKPGFKGNKNRWKRVAVRDIDLKRSDTNGLRDMTPRKTGKSAKK